jgi:hypothetical protein
MIKLVPLSPIKKIVFVFATEGIIEIILNWKKKNTNYKKIIKIINLK